MSIYRCLNDERKAFRSDMHTIPESKNKNTVKGIIKRLMASQIVCALPFSSSSENLPGPQVGFPRGLVSEMTVSWEELAFST